MDDKDHLERSAGGWSTRTSIMLTIKHNCKRHEIVIEGLKKKDKDKDFDKTEKEKRVWTKSNLTNAKEKTNNNNNNKKKKEKKERKEKKESW